MLTIKLYLYDIIHKSKDLLEEGLLILVNQIAKDISRKINLQKLNRKVENTAKMND